MRVVRVAVVAYLLASLMLYLAQNWIIFPGAFIHRGPESIVRPAPGREVLELRAPEGHRVAAIFGAALNADGTPRADAAARPTVLFFYGNGDCIKTSLWVFDAFRQLGANVLIPEYVGYPMSGGKPSEAGVYATADAGYAYLLARPDIDRRQIVIAGRSLGGAAAMDLAARKPVAGLATFSAFTSMAEMGRKVLPMFPTSLFLRSKFDNWQKIRDVQCPIFMAHGTHDSLVPFTMMARLVEQARQPVIEFPIEGADHNDIFLVGGQSMLDRFGAFLETVHRTASNERPAPPN